jgi:hypothetical protein
MENDNKLKQPKTQETSPKTDVWTSGFDSKSTPKASPPPMQLSSDPIKGPQETDEGEYDPETIVFDIGGFADPQNPGGDNGKGIKVTIPPDLDGPSALVQVVMQMLRLTESEAKIAIVKENLQWVDYHVNGQGLDRMGNAVHLLRFKPTYAERVAHEPKSEKPTDAGDKDRFNAFKLYLAEHDCDNIRDPYLQYDKWAQDNGMFIPMMSSPSYGMHGLGMADNRGAYEKQREAVVEIVVWERLRAKRESLSTDIANQKTSLKGNVEQMADQLPSLVDLSHLQYSMPERYYNAWTALHARMIVAQGEWEKGNMDFFQQGDLRAKIYQLAYWFADFAQNNLGSYQSEGGGKRFAQFNPNHVQEILSLKEAKTPTQEQGQRLMYLYYHLTFTLIEVGGRLMEVHNTKSLLNPIDNDALSQEGQLLKNRGKAGNAMLDLLDSHPTAQKVHATFYPEEETKDFRQDGESKGGDDWSQGFSLELFIWHDAEENEWVLEDFSNIGSTKVNRAAGAHDAPVPAALFEELNSKLRFPKGALFYRLPEEGSYRILRTTAETTWADWLRTAAIGGLAIGMALATAGASIPANVVMIGSTLLMAGSVGLDWAEEYENGMMTTEKVILDSALIATCVLSGASTGFGMAANAGKLGARGLCISRAVAGMQVAADSTCIAMFTKEAFEGLYAAAKEPEGVTFQRLLGFFLQMGMNGLMLLSIKHAGKTAKDGLAVGAAEKETAAMDRQLNAKAKRSLREESIAAREREIVNIKSSLDDDLTAFFGKERGRVIQGKLTGAGAFGLGSLTVNISVQNFRKLVGIVKTMQRNGIELTVESVILKLEKLGLRSRILLSADKSVLETVIADVKRENMTAEEIAFADSYYLHVADSELTNYELRELHRRGYTVDAETGSLIKPNGRTVDFKHQFLPNDQKSKTFDFNRFIDFEADGDLMELVKGRQRLREKIAEMRRGIKERQAKGEVIPKAELDAFNKAASEIGEMSWEIAERSLQKYLDGEGFIQVYPEIGAAPSSKSGDFDRIYLKESEGKYQIFEVKGGTSPIGDRYITDVAGIKPHSVAQQGTLPYLKQILHEMGKNPKTQQLAIDLKAALELQEVEYLSYRQGFTEQGKMKQPEIHQFDITK